MSKGSGSAGRASATARNVRDFADSDFDRLLNSSDWFIRNGMRSYDENTGDYDESDMSGLSKKEKTYIVAYMSNAYPTINATLRGENDSADARLLAEKVDGALVKLKNYEGTVYRGETFPSAKAMSRRINEFKKLVGKTYESPSLTSTGAVRDRIVRKFTSSDGNSILYTIKSKTGKDLRKYNGEEYEVLFRARTKFRVLSVRGRNVSLEEL